MKSIANILFVAIATSLISSCESFQKQNQSNVNEEVSARESQEGQNVIVDFSGDRLYQDLEVENRLIRKAGLLQEGGLRLINTSNNLYHLEYRVDWEDSYGYLVDGPTVWHRIVLHPDTTKYIKSTSKTKNGVRMRVSIRLPDDELLEGKYLQDGE